MASSGEEPRFYRLILGILGVWRVTHLLANEDGPGDIVFRLRRRLGDSLIGSLMDCFHCLSFWVAIPAAFFVTTRPVVWAVSWLALSGAACLLDRAQHEAGERRSRGIVDDKDARHPWLDLRQQVEPLAGERSVIISEAGEIAAGMGEVFGKPGADRVDHHGKHAWRGRHPVGQCHAGHWHLV